jgi:PRC-barrel domain protein
MIVELWTYREDVAVPADLEGFEVDGRDGKVGKIDEATNEVGGSFLVVDTGPWIFGRKVMIPASRIDRIDLDNRKVLVDLTKDQIKSSPEYDPDTFGKSEYRERVGSYYGSMKQSGETTRS